MPMVLCLVSIIADMSKLLTDAAAQVPKLRHDTDAMCVVCEFNGGKYMPF